MILRPLAVLTCATSLSVLAALALSLPAHAAVERKSHAAMVQTSIDAVIIPRVEALAGAASALEAAVKASCEEPSNGDKAKAARDAFAKTVGALGGIDFVRFGPIMEQSRLERMFFWPDPRGIAARQLTQLLAAKDTTLLDAAALTQQSAAVQGLSALEAVLYTDTPKDAETAKFRCGYAAAVAANVAAMARDVKDTWTAPQGFRLKMLTPGSDNALYKDSSETARDVVKAIVTGIELTTNRYAAPELEAAAATPPKKARLPFERSGLTYAYLNSGIEGMKALFDETSLIAFAPADKEWMTEFVPKAFKNLSEDAAKLEAAKGSAPGDEARLAAAKKLKFDLNSVRMVIVRELAPGADLTLGFNELDGD